MKKIHKFHIIIITCLVVGMLVNNIGEANGIQLINNLFLCLITFAYIVANIIEYSKK